MRLIVLLCCLFVCDVYGLDLSTLSRELAGRGNPWVAGTTSVSNLSVEEKRALSVSPEFFDIEAPRGHYYPVTDYKFPPPSWDWRNYEGHNWMTPVKSQWACGSCWCFATVACFESRIKITNNIPDTSIDLSEEFFISCDVRDWGCHGGSLFYAAQFVTETGVVDESCFPYAGEVLPCINRCPDWESRLTKATNWGYTPYVFEFKLRLMEGPLACWLTPTEDFFHYKGGVYEPVMGDKYVHAVCLCGWDDVSGAWLFKNSWGEAWGDSGYGLVKYGLEHLVGPCGPIWFEVEPSKISDVKMMVPLEISGPVILPRHGEISFSFSIDEVDEVIVAVYDVSGKKVRSLVSGLLASGNHHIRWDGRDALGVPVSQGIYFLYVKSRRGVGVKKVVRIGG